MTKRFYVYGTGAVGSELTRLFEKHGAENTSAAGRAALGQGVKFDSPEDWAVEIICPEDDLDAATRYDDSVSGFIVVPFRLSQDWGEFEPVLRTELKNLGASEDEIEIVLDGAFQAAEEVTDVAAFAAEELELLRQRGEVNA